jgi:hypothetical protein
MEVAHNSIIESARRTKGSERFMRPIKARTDGAVEFGMMPTGGRIQGRIQVATGSIWR